ncbi:hypothetical protein F5146DRAFT_336506 [Armillaria mellea]|nr:hypothetical protein F5146DRAFT_336506 [Armillaria mellea]
MRYEQDWYRQVSCYDLFAPPDALRGPVFSLGSLTGSWAGRWVTCCVIPPAWIRGPCPFDSDHHHQSPTSHGRRDFLSSAYMLGCCKISNEKQCEEIMAQTVNCLGHTYE